MTPLHIIDMVVALLPLILGILLISLHSYQKRFIEIEKKHGNESAIKDRKKGRGIGIFLIVIGIVGLVLRF